MQSRVMKTLFEYGMQAATVCHIQGHCYWQIEMNTLFDWRTLAPENADIAAAITRRHTMRLIGDGYYDGRVYIDGFEIAI